VGAIIQQQLDQLLAAVDEVVAQIMLQLLEAQIQEAVAVVQDTPQTDQLVLEDPALL
jgi:DNA-binding FrmR family transcriptional regulator